ncbi:Rop family plasmid primer RNA-binding protein [Salmonella enterica]|uniref:Rop family plasmid primer RNA-binding protein n=1 Tax=Salmonella enterica TaxID=28901 RepID=UPI003B284B1B
MNPFFFSLKIITTHTKQHINPHQSPTLNIHKFIPTQTLLFLQKIHQLHLHHPPTQSQKLHQHPQNLYHKLLPKLHSPIPPYLFHPLNNIHKFLSSTLTLLHTSLNHINNTKQPHHTLLLN